MLFPHIRYFVATLLLLCSAYYNVQGDKFKNNVDTLQRCLSVCSLFPMICHNTVCKKAFAISAERLKNQLNLNQEEINLIWELEREAQSNLRYWNHWTYRIPITRRECRDLSTRQRRDLFYAINYLKRNTSNPNVYVTLAKLHRGPSLDVHAHGGSNFLGWHRYYLYYYEIALRRVRRNIALCYYDSTIDFRLGRDEWIYTNAFSELLFGNADGVVRTGPFTNWVLPAPNEGLILQRDMQAGIAQPMDPKAVNLMLTSPMLLNHSTITRGGFGHGTITNKLNRTRRVTLEGEHDNVHVWIGAAMGALDTAPLDPMFYFHHCYIDYVWEKFRTKMKKYRRNPETDYPGHGDPSNARDYPMIGFNWNRNIDGYSDFFTRKVYRYADSPSCTGYRASCRRSRFMKCNAKRECVAKKRPIPVTTAIVQPFTIVPIVPMRTPRPAIIRPVPSLILTGRRFTASSNSE